ncbi:CLUMA_CG011319, isoform A [Clunio marinus]|uniref:CLUMA_CG011319, isoform A n=1 Tax=Clunio marinus TaxID=568069 RepID=A0A1J1IDV3_9DIPT|nr:CLUMA_CG011319, isoform A [Clunio marinus]
MGRIQAARNIRNLPCIAKRSGLKGVCMFAIDCIKSNGTHLGTCIDKFYFGSCCQMKLQDVDSIYNPEISDNRIDTSFSTSSHNTNSISEKPFVPASSSSTTSLSTPVTHIASNYKTTLKPVINYNNKTFELIPTSSKRPQPTTESATEKYTVQVGGFTTTLGTIIQRNISSSIGLSDEPTTTEGIKLTTFQSIQDTKKSTTKLTTKQPTLSTTQKKTTNKKHSTKPSNSTKKPVSVQAFNRTSVSSSATSTAKITRRPVTTIKPSKNATSTVIKTTRKPVASTNVTVNRRTTISSRRNSTISTRKPTTITTSTTPEALITISYVETTKVPRPRPTPTDFVVKVEPSTLSTEDLLVTTFSVNSVDRTSSMKPSFTTAKPTMTTSTVKSTSVTRRTTKRPSPSSTTVSIKKPITEPSTSTTIRTTTINNLTSSSVMKDETSSRPFNLTSTERTTTEGKVEIPTTSTSPSALVTWTIENDFVENTTKEQNEDEETTTIEISESEAIKTNLTSSTNIESEDTSHPVNISSSTQRPNDESMPVINPDETTMWSVTQRNNETSEAASSIQTSTEESVTRFNESSSVSYPTSAIPNLEGVDYKTICGKRMFPEPRIVGGAKASFGRWPWQISLRQWRTSTYLHKCGSALLNENWAISAAHCVDNVPPSDLLLRLGEYDLSIEEEPYGYQERRVQIVASHPQFDPRTFEYDLALLRFFEPVVFQPNIIPVCVPEIDENFIGRTAYVTGWGRLYEDGPLPSVLQEVTVPVIKNEICESMYRNAGIGCAEPNQPGVYTRISEFRDWINQILMF